MEPLTFTSRFTSLCSVPLRSIPHYSLPLLCTHVLHPSTSTSQFQTLSASPMSPQAPVVAGVTPLTPHSCAVPSLTWHRLCFQRHQIKIETEQRVVQLGLSPFLTYLPWPSSTQNQATGAVCHVSTSSAKDFSTDNALGFKKYPARDS